MTKLRKKVGEVRMSGPFHDWPMDRWIVSPVGVVPKKERGEFRLIQHLSWPDGQSVNDSIPEDLTPVTYSSVDMTIDFV